ncbi:hypothetical protein [Cerasicoccus arenae]|uniref:DNA replication/recombination mediator RecO N-terminal domain-containing protein n=1 Tax=Cerasicoccus arenae TaxID=424488 RepID=A0A8J3DCP9_9BACT|nr:hypothetical protein [Cerasicoccus arenae]MBK1858502.1 hypothetical protein [Cerasicoccus arenae]GHC10233.1 hypothetical protein GCM10007047_29440 [Cerasicoccus arenae]
MPARELQAVGVVLATVPSGERFLRLNILSPDEGRLVAMWRRSNKNSGSSPDLFDQAVFHLEGSSSATTWFLKEYRLEHSRRALARSYRTLQLATRLGELLWRNLPHTEFFAPTAQLAIDAFNAFESSTLPQCVYLKALYRYAAEEGYAVRQHWLADMPTREQERARSIIHQPLEMLSAENDTVAGTMIEKIERWLRADTDIIVP